MPELPASLRIFVDVTRQRCDLLAAHGEFLASYPVSTSKFGLGSEEGSFRTPTGNFLISEKIGDGEPSWMIFKERIATGVLANAGGEEDQILSRILRLEGVEPQNSNTHERYIYFHGTNREDLIGLPASHGCIRLRNPEMIDLFDRVRVGNSVKITL